MPALTKDLEADFCRLWRDHQNVTARNTVVESLLPSLSKWATKIDRKRGLYDEIYAILCESLIRQMKTYDPDKSGARVLTYCHAMMQREVSLFFETRRSAYSFRRSQLYQRVSQMIRTDDETAQQHGSYEAIKASIQSHPITYEVLGEEDTGEDLEETVARRERLRKIDAVVRVLPERQRKIFELRHYSAEQPSYDEIALVMGIGRELVRTEAHAALAAVRLALNV